MGDMKEIELLDFFAGHALGGILFNANYPGQSSGEPLEQFAARVTERAYRIAEAMMKEGRRLKKEGKSTPW